MEPQRVDTAKANEHAKKTRERFRFAFESEEANTVLEALALLRATQEPDGPAYQLMADFQKLFELHLDNTETLKDFEKPPKL